jgi:ribosomal protein S18 acetylase RimI-like enzyme
VDRSLILRQGGAADARPAAAVGIASRRAARRALFSDEYLEQLDVAAEAADIATLLADASKDARLWVAERSGSLVAFGLTEMWPEDDGVRSAYLDSLYVDPSLFRQGIGSTLLAFVESKLAEEGFVSAYLWSLEIAIAAAAFYEATGWRRTGRSKLLHLDNPRTVELWTKSLL